MIKKLAFICWVILIFPLGIKCGLVLAKGMALFKNAADGVISSNDAYSANSQIINSLWVSNRFFFGIWFIGLITFVILSVRQDRRKRLSKS